MKRFSGYRQLLFLPIILTILLSGSISAEAIIADHNAVEAFNDIPANWIDSVANLQFYYIHQSHGSQIIQGMKIIYTENNDYYPPPMVALWWPYPGGEEMGWNGDTAFVQYVRAYLDTNTVNCKMVSVSWCAAAYTCSESEINKWMTGWLHLVNDYPDVAFVVQTSRLYDPHTQTFEGQGRRIMRANQYIRNFANAHNMYVLDYGDIEGYNTLTDQLDSLANDSGTTWWADYCNAGNNCPDCVSDGIFPESYWKRSSQGVTESCAHSYSSAWGGVNCYRKAKAWWWLMARIAGWNGSSGGDTQAPVISNATVSGITETSATVTWTTDEPATSQVEYGYDANYGWTSPLNSSLTTSHSVTLTGLTADTPYHCRPKSRDGSSNEAVGQDISFRTNAPPPPPDTIDIAGVSVPTGSTSVTVPVNIQNCQSLAAFDIPIRWSSADLTCDSVSFVGSRVAYINTKLFDIDNANRRLHAGVIVVAEAYLPPDSGLAFTIYFSLSPTASAQTIAVDTTFFPPSGSFITTDTAGTTHYPIGKPGAITVYTPTDTIPPERIDDLGLLPDSIPIYGLEGKRFPTYVSVRVIGEAIDIYRNRFVS